jgi:hypothetical protein
MDKYDVMRAFEELPESEQAEVVRWASQRLAHPSKFSPHSGPSIKQKILATLSEEEISLKELVIAVYGIYNASKRQMIHSRLAELMRAGKVIRPVHGKYRIAGSGGKE